MNVRFNLLSLLRKTLVISLLTLITQSLAFAEPLLIPGFLGIESSHVELPAAGSDSTSAYFTLTNLHYEPILILSASSEFFDNATLVDSNNETLEYIELLPGERLDMQTTGMHFQLNNIEGSLAAGDIQEITLLVRRGREAMEYVEEFFDNSIRETFGGGIPNEKEYVTHISVRN
jgi:copper(I)-binding protein